MRRVLPVLMTSLLLASCGLTEPNVVGCGDDCPAIGAGNAGASGAGGGNRAGSGGAGAGGGDGGFDGGAGSDAGAGGNAGASGTGGDSGIDGGGGDGACGACPEATPHCTIDQCVQCLEDAHCEDGVCLSNTCRPCRADRDCTQPDASRCMEGECVACANPAHCAHLDDTSICDDGTCVQCTATDASACGFAPGGSSYVCDVLARTCSTHTHRSASLCDPCVSDDQCGVGQLCAMQRFDEVGDDPDQGDIDVGYFCFWREDATEPNAPAGDCANVRPYVATLTGSESVAGAEASLCGLRVTTCASYKDYSTKPCAGLDDDATCGDERFDSDGYCEMFSASNYRCTTRCLSADDCKDGSTCQTGTIPNVCSL